MNYTPEELQKLSDDEINKLVAIHLDRNYGLNAVPNFCQNPSDIMPIAFEQGIQIKVFTVVDKKPGKWWADNYLAGDRYNYMINTNPLRAICEVFILMNQGAES